MQHCDNLKILRVAGGQKIPRVDPVIRETEVVIQIDGKVHRRLTCVAEHLEELALGYLFDEGIASPDSVDMEVEGNTISVWRKHRSRSRKPAVVDSDLKVLDGQILAWVDELNRNCPLHIGTGGTHIVGIVHGDVMLFVEDISRHCAIDKAIGIALRSGFRMADCVLVTSCRQTLSAMRKEVRVGIPVVASRAAPTTLAISEAEIYGVTLVGFVRGGEFNIYSHPHRIVTGSR